MKNTFFFFSVKNKRVLNPNLNQADTLWTFCQCVRVSVLCFGRGRRYATNPTVDRTGARADIHRKSLDAPEKYEEGAVPDETHIF